MKANHLFASAMVAAGLIFSASTQAGGLVGGFGAAMGSSLGGGLRSADMQSGFGAMAMGNGAVNGRSSGLGHHEQDVAHDKAAGSKAVGNEKQVAGAASDNSTSSARNARGVAGESAGTIAGSAAATSTGKGRGLSSESEGSITAVGSRGSEPTGATDNVLAVAGSGASNTTPSRAANASDSPTKSPASPSTSSPTTTMQASSEATGGLTASKSGLGADAADQGALSYGSSSVDHAGYAGASMSR